MIVKTTVLVLELFHVDHVDFWPRDQKIHSRGRKHITMPKSQTQNTELHSMKSKYSNFREPHTVHRYSRLIPRSVYRRRVYNNNYKHCVLNFSRNQGHLNTQRSFFGQRRKLPEIALESSLHKTSQQPQAVTTNLQINNSRPSSTSSSCTGISYFFPLDYSILGDFDQTGTMEHLMDASTIERLSKPTTSFS